MQRRIRGQESVGKWFGRGEGGQGTITSCQLIDFMFCRRRFRHGAHPSFHSALVSTRRYEISSFPNSSYCLSDKVYMYRFSFWKPSSNTCLPRFKKATGGHFAEVVIFICRNVAFAERIYVDFVGKKRAFRIM
uniref:Uncharacterized protein n=1 Tax=Setaria digitata TaxID=48799 RepID=A0A915PDA0_9BILA